MLQRGFPWVDGSMRKAERGEWNRVITTALHTTVYYDRLGHEVSSLVTDHHQHGGPSLSFDGPN